MQYTLAKIFGFLLLLLGAIGLLAGDRQLFGFINVDIALDIARLGLAAFLLYAVYAANDRGLVRTGLIILGVSYLIIGFMSLADAGLYGILPSRMSEFDKLFHIASSALALMVAVRNERTAISRS